MSPESKGLTTRGEPAVGPVPTPAVGKAARRRPWRSIVFAPVGDGATRRRGSDGFRVAAAALILLCCWLITTVPAHPETVITKFLTPPPNGVRWLVSLVWWFGSIGLIALLGLLALLSRRREVVRDVLGSGAVAWLLSLGMTALVGANGGHHPTPALHGVNFGFPLARVAAAMAVATAALPYLSRSFQRILELIVALAALSSVVQGSGLPISVVASLVIGWGVTAAVHLVFGSPLGLPSAAEVAALMEDVGIHARGLYATPDQVWGVARYQGEDGGGPLAVSVYGRDARDAQLLAKTYRFLAYRDSGPTLTLTRVQQVEHEAYLTLLAGRAGVHGPEVLTAGTIGPSRDAVLISRPPAGSSLDELVQVAAARDGAVGDGDPALLSEGALDDLFTGMLALRRARIAHGAISPATVVVADDGAVGLVDFRNATAAGRAERIDRDLAAALATASLGAGPQRVVASAERVLPRDVLAAALPFLQRAALDPVLSRALRGHKSMLEELREVGAEAAGVDVPKLAEPRRISWVTLAIVAGSVIGGWALIGVLINVTQSWSTITGARWGWVVATFVFAQLAYLANAVETTGSIVDRLSYGRVVALEVANAFVALAGGTMAVLATRVRFFQQEGYDATLAVSSGVVISTVSWIVKGALFLIALPLAIGSMHFTTTPSGGSHSHVVWLIIVVIVGVAVFLGVVLAVPRLRRVARDKLRPKLSEVLGHLRVLAGHPRKMVEIFGGAAMSQLTIAFALGTALHAFDQHLSLASLLVVLTLASMLGGVSPVPGGMGVVEAGMIIGLTAAGIPQDDAVAATFVQRLFTSYLPPIWGWFVLVWMRRREYL
ncbi:MAG TPA: YbhN family protein [Acidimicrobiales bacterium]|nr:YbhN family protein [Acidimicrobiales bacterium]